MWASGKGNLATAQQEAAFPTFTALLAKALPSPSLPSGNEGREGNLMGEAEEVTRAVGHAKQALGLHLKL